MKVALVFLIAFAIFLQGSECFYGLNLIYSPGVKMSSACIKATSQTINVPSKLEQSLKIIIKFKSDEYEAASESLSDLSHFFIGLSSFLNQYSVFLVDQETDNPLKIITLLIYNAQLMEAATKQIETAPKNFATLYGSNLESVLTLIIGKFTEQITNLRISLETLESNFQSIAEAESDVTIDVLDAEIDAQAITDSITAFTEIAVASKQISMIVTGINAISHTLDLATSSVLIAAERSRATISLTTFAVNMEIQSAKFTFGDEVRTNVQTIVEAFGNYSRSSLTVFANTTSPDFLNFLQDQQNAIEEYGTSMGELLVKIQGEFSKRLQDYYNSFYEIITGIQATLTANSEDLSAYIANLIIQGNGASFKACFANGSEIQNLSLVLLDKMKSSFVDCVVTERTLTTQLEALMTFIVEDVTLNAQGAADRLCGCSVKGGKKVMDQTQECIGAVVDELSSKTIVEDEKYLTRELEVVDEVLIKSEERFTQCTADISTTFEADYEQFQQAALACLVSS